MMEELEFRVNFNDRHYTDKDIDLIKFAVSEMFCEGDEQEFLICDKGGREIEVRDYIRESLWAFNTRFILDHSNIKYSNIKCYANEVVKEFQKMQEVLCESANELVYAMIKDFDQFVQDAVKSDGYGHFLSPYDGKEHEVIIFGRTFYVYRIN